MKNFTGYITIKETCHVGWENMTPSEKGKFCASCKKQVHDFTNSTVEDIKAAYIENNGNLCGHVPTKLLQEEYIKSEIRKVHFGSLKTFCFASILCFGANLFTINKAKASTLQNIKKTFLTIFSNIENDSITIKGIVIDKTSHLPVKFATVSLVQSNTTISTAIANINGEYKIKVPKNKYSKVSIVASFIGYTSEVIKNILKDNNQNINLNIEIELYTMQIEGGIKNNIEK